MNMQRCLFRCATLACVAAFSVALPDAASAGPPFLTDDPDPTPYRHYEIYLFGAETRARGGESGDSGLDFNYGAAPDLQLTATLPLSYERPDGEKFRSGLGNIEVAAKYQILHQETSGWNVAVFPRLFLPSGSSLSDNHASFLLPVWVGKQMGSWSTFGGGGCALNRGGESQDYCVAGWTLARRFSQGFMLGAEVFHETPDTKDGVDSTVLGIGGAYDLTERVHLLGYVNSGLKNTAEAGLGSWYASLLFTF